MTKRQVSSTPARTLVAAVLLALGWGTFLAASVDTELPFTPLRPFDSPSLVARNLAPQGWGFFTRDPLEPSLAAYVRGPNGWHSAILGPNAQPEHLFGWRRDARAQGVEMGALLFSHGRNAFSPCETDLQTCLEEAPIEGNVDNPVPSPTLCGPVALIRRHRVPWAWARSVDPRRVPIDVLNLEVAC